MAHDIKSALDSGFKDYITKPIDLNLLVDVVAIQKTLHAPYDLNLPKVLLK